MLMHTWVGLQWWELDSHSSMSATREGREGAFSLRTCSTRPKAGPAGGPGWGQAFLDPPPSPPGTVGADWPTWNDLIWCFSDIVQNKIKDSSDYSWNSLDAAGAANALHHHRHISLRGHDHSQRPPPAPGSQTMKSPICGELRGEVGGSPAVFGQAAKISHNVAPLCQLGPGALQEGGGGPGELGQQLQGWGTCWSRLGQDL